MLPSVTAGTFLRGLKKNAKTKQKGSTIPRENNAEKGPKPALSIMKKERLHKRRPSGVERKSHLLSMSIRAETLGENVGGKYDNLRLQYSNINQL